MTGDSKNKTFSFRQTLTGELADFLRDEGISCDKTTSAIVVLTAELAHYREEGVELTPTVYICDDIAKIAAILGGAEVVRISKGDRTDDTIRKILKICAPLARGGYAVYVERRDDSFAFGLLRDVNIPLSITPEEALVEMADREVPALILRRIARNCVEVLGCRRTRRCIHFSADREDSPSPLSAIRSLAAAITRDITDPSQQASTCRLVVDLVGQILQHSHGALAIVLKKDTALPEQLRDMVVLDPPISIVERVSAFMSDKAPGTMYSLQGLAHLLEGMFQSDGIVVFRSDGIVVGFRGFHQGGAVPLDVAIHAGGNRRRTYGALSALVGTTLSAAFFRSQDGHTEAHTDNNND
jgi:hypothetical protein